MQEPHRAGKVSLRQVTCGALRLWHHPGPHPWALSSTPRGMFLHSHRLVPGGEVGPGQSPLESDLRPCAGFQQLPMRIWLTWTVEPRVRAPGVLQVLPLPGSEAVIEVRGSLKPDVQGLRAAGDPRRRRDVESYLPLQQLVMSDI